MDEMLFSHIDLFLFFFFFLNLLCGGAVIWSSILRMWWMEGSSLVQVKTRTDSSFDLIYVLLFQH